MARLVGLSPFNSFQRLLLGSFGQFVGIELRSEASHACGYELAITVAVSLGRRDVA